LKRYSSMSDKPRIKTSSEGTGVKTPMEPCVVHDRRPASGGAPRWIALIATMIVVIAALKAGH
jgi:hypothetical protein